MSTLSKRVKLEPLVRGRQSTRALTCSLASTHASQHVEQQMDDDGDGVEVLIGGLGQKGK